MVSPDVETGAESMHLGDRVRSQLPSLYFLHYGLDVDLLVIWYQIMKIGFKFFRFFDGVRVWYAYYEDHKLL